MACTRPGRRPRPSHLINVAPWHPPHVRRHGKGAEVTPAWVCAGVEEAQEEASPAGAEAKAAPPPPQSEEAAVQTIRAPRGGAGATQQRGDSDDLQQESDGEGDEGASSGQVNVYGFF